METPPLVSIITPTYNHEKYIDECIASVKAQTYSHWEQIIIDDGSTDGTYEAAMIAIDGDDRIQLHRQPNLGIFKLADTYNKALALCKGKYIAILEGDDYWEKEKLELQVAELEKDEGIVLVWSKAYGRVLDSKSSSDIYPKSGFYSNIEIYNNEPLGSFYKLLFNAYCPPLTFLILKEKLILLGGFKQILPFPAIDLNTFLELSLVGRFKFIDKVLGTWRISPNQTTKLHGVEIFEGSKKIFLNHFKKLEFELEKKVEIDLKDIEQNFKKRHVITYSRMGRFSLIRKKYLDARRYYLQSIFIHWNVEPIWKIRSIIGLAASFFKLDVEVLADLFGKGSLKK